MTPEAIKVLKDMTAAGVFVVDPDSEPVPLRMHGSFWSMSTILKRVARLPDDEIVTTTVEPSFFIHQEDLGVATMRYCIFSIDAPEKDGVVDHVCAQTTDLDTRRCIVTPTKPLKSGRRYVLGITSNWKDKAWGPILTQ